MKAKKTAKADLNNKRGLFFQVGLAVSLLATIGFFTWSQPAVSVETLDFETAVDIYELPPITFDEPEKTETAMPKIVPIVDIINIVRDDIKIEPSEVDPFDIDPNELFVFGPIGQPGSGNPEALQPDVFDFMVIEDQPLFQGKDLKAFRQWIMKNIDYPSMAAENGV
ncbi:hypothetical protein LJB87_02675 [Alistipes sp. OttesenSCG-928-L06]|nr:hypothetical protein [Alistipes sp. OttesenSCG-928-L06]